MSTQAPTKRCTRMNQDTVNARTMGSTSSTARDAERIRRARDIRARTVVLRLDPAGKPYSRLDVAHGLAATGTFSSDFRDLEAIGPLNRNAEWFITVSSLETKMRLLAETVTVNGKLGTFAPAGVSEFRARVHWLPQWVDNQSVYDSFKSLGLDVVQVTTDKSTVKIGKSHSLLDALITVRSVIIRADSIDKIPHLIKIKEPAFGETVEALVTVPRRPPLCLRCRQVGHIRGQCVAAFCTRCKKFGHREPECTAQKGSYANVAGAKVPAPNEEEADMDEANILLTDEDRSSSDGEEKADASKDSSKDSKTREREAVAPAHVVEEPAEEKPTPTTGGANAATPRVEEGVADDPPQREETPERMEESDLDLPPVIGSWADQEVVNTSSDSEGWAIKSPRRRERRAKRPREITPSRKGRSLSPSYRSKKK